MCNIEKHMSNFYKNYSERRDCKSRRGLKPYYENKEETSHTRKMYYEKKMKINFYRHRTVDIYNLKK